LERAGTEQHASEDATGAQLEGPRAAVGRTPQLKNR
jgi:hypothetical protein